MPITADSMVHTPYLFAAFSGFQGIKNGAHTVFTAAAARVKYTTTPANSGLELVSFTKDAAGDTVYLSYFPNEITSVRLPNPPPPGVTTFTTDNLSGCRVFVDTIAGSNDVVVYHANAKLHSPAVNRGAVLPAEETGAATRHLDTLHTDARLFYGNQHLALADGSDIDKPFYNQNAHAAVQRKIGQGRKRLHTPDPKKSESGFLDLPEFVGGTVVMGFFKPAGAVPGHWEFHYQTWGDVEYKRPAFSPKGWFKGREKTADRFQVLQYGQFFPLV